MPIPFRAAVRGLCACGILFALLFGAAGRLNWAGGWVFFAAFAATGAVCVGVASRVNPAVVEARARPRRAARRLDRWLLTLYAIELAAIFIVAGLDAGRFHPRPMSLPWICGGLALQTFGSSLITWAMCVNPYFEAAIRIQQDRGHRVISTGPYAILRHPGYAGMIPVTIAWPLILGSIWAFIPAVLLLVWLAVRAALEDRLLQRDLPGYAEYAQRTKCRLVPFVW